MSFSITGNAGIGNAVVYYTGTSSGSQPAGIFGAYTLTVANGTYTITPTLVGYRFFPPSQNVTVAGGNVSGVDFTASNSLNIFRVIPPFGPETFCDPGLSNFPDGVTDTACRLVSVKVDNSLNSSASYVKLYNLSSGNTVVGTSVPSVVLRVPAGEIIYQEFHTGNYPGSVFTTALSLAATTTGGQTGNTGPIFPITVSVAFSGD